MVHDDALADEYERRYETNPYNGVRTLLRSVLARLQQRQPKILEVGCGTGHWVRELSADALVVGLDPSASMLRRGRERAPAALLLQGSGEALPFRTATFDGVIFVNALHHCTDPSRALEEGARVMTNGATVVTIGLDPHTGADRWWVYEYFPRARELDLGRFRSTDWIRTTVAGVWRAVWSRSSAKRRRSRRQGREGSLLVASPRS